MHLCDCEISSAAFDRHVSEESSPRDISSILFANSGRRRNSGNDGFLTNNGKVALSPDISFEHFEGYYNNFTRVWLVYAASNEPSY